MKHTLLVITILLSIPSFLSVDARPRQSGANLPSPADFVRAGPSCKKTVKLTPWVGTPAVDFPNTYQCEMNIHTCEGVKKFKSGVRNAGAGMCADYWAAYRGLVDLVICCDPGSRDDNRPPDQVPPAKAKCEEPTGWVGDTSGCRDRQATRISFIGTTVRVSMCGYVVFSYTSAHLTDPLAKQAYEAALRQHLNFSVSSRVCCDKFQEAVRTRRPCNPRVDVDCDGTPNSRDTTFNNQMPDIDAFVSPPGASIDTFPARFDATSPEFLPDRAASESRGVGECPCKWELVKGELNCSSDGRTRHHYKATWRCPSNGTEVITFRYAPATAYCGN